MNKDKELFLLEPKKENSVKVDYRYITEVMGLPLQFFIEFVHYVNGCVSDGATLEHNIDELLHQADQDADEIERILENVEQSDLDL